MHFTFITAGESHGKGLVAIIEGLPAGLTVDVAFINHELWRRQQGYGRGGRMKIESDEVEILAGVRHGATLGSPVAFLIRNRDFEHWVDVMNVEPRDFTEEKRARGHLKPISTLRRPLSSVDVISKDDSAAAFERSDNVAGLAAGVIGEA